MGQIICGAFTWHGAALEEMPQQEDGSMSRLRAAEFNAGGRLTAKQLCDFIEVEEDTARETMLCLPDDDATIKKFFQDIAQMFMAVKAYAEQDKKVLPELNRRWPRNAPPVLIMGSIMSPDTGDFRPGAENMKNLASCAEVLAR